MGPLWAQVPVRTGDNTRGFERMVAYTYPLLDLFWSILWVFLFVLWIWLLIAVFSDIFRSPDLSGWGKALWFIFVLFIPFLGVFVYLIARGHKMQEHAARAAKQEDEAAKQYIRSAAGDGSAGDELSKLADLRDRGVITPQEFEREKAKILA